MKHTYTFAVMLLMAALGAPSVAQNQEGQSSNRPQLETSDMITATATVQDVDHEKRTVTLKGKDGRTDVIKVGPEVRNFDRIKSGDQVKMAYYESAAVSIRKADEPEARTGAKDTVLVSNAGGKPGKTEIRTTQLAATVENVDLEKREVTLKGREGKSKILKVEEEVKNLDKIKAGDQVVVNHTEAFAVTVESP